MNHRTILSGAKIRQPSLFIAGELDGVIMIYRQALDGLEELYARLEKEGFVAGCRTLDPAKEPVPMR